MQTIRRLYLYAVTFVSLLVVLWGVIGLARSLFSGQQVGGSVSQLAGALSFILVGVPVFLVHWYLAQRSAMREIEERSSRLRAIFLYGTLLSVLIPTVNNTISLLDRTFLAVLRQPTFRAMVGGSQSLSDNLVAIFLNVSVSAYFYTVLRTDWRASPQGEGYADTRRLYRYIWMLFGLILTVFGGQQVLYYLLGFWNTVGAAQPVALANGLAALIVGTPIWLFAWSRIQRSLYEPDEAQSLLRLIVLYALAFVSLSAVLINLGLFFYATLRFAFGETMSWMRLLSDISAPLSVAIAFIPVWVYFRRVLSSEMDAWSDEPRRAELKRLFFYALSLAGLIASFIGAQMLLFFLLDILLSPEAIWGDVLRRNLAAALSTLAIGLPLWLLAWRPVIRESSAEGESGDRARRSILRKGYLYIVLFAGVLGVMFSTGALLFQILSAILGQPPLNLLVEAAQLLAMVLLFVLVATYHWQALRRDNRIAERSLTRRHTQFPVLVLAPDEGEFASIMLSALEREAPALPVAVHTFTQGAPDETLSAARAVILPSELLTKLPESLRLWLQGFDGPRLVVPTPIQGWDWLLSGEPSLTSLAPKTARMVRSLAEGEAINRQRAASSWMIVVYILAGLFALQIFGLIIASLISLIQG